MARLSTPISASVLPAIGAALAVLSLVGSVRAMQVSELSPTVLKQARSAGLVTQGIDPIPRFSWAIEQRRPLRSTRRMSESFQGSDAATAGLSPMTRITTRADGDRRVDGVSLRGLMAFSPQDETLDARLEGFTLPMRTGARFSLEYRHDDGRAQQSCTVGASQPASSVFASIPGDVFLIDCDGDARYRGIRVGLSSRVAYFPKLGMFVNLADVIDTPLGKIQSGTKITAFRFGP